MNRVETTVLAAARSPFALASRLSLNATSPQAFREALRAYFIETFDATESLFRTLACPATKPGTGGRSRCATR